MIGINYSNKLFFFTNTLNDIIKKKFNKFRNLNIIYKPDINKLNIIEFLKIKYFCKKKKSKFIIQMTLE